MEEAIFDDVDGTFIGIDLGTSNSVVTFFKDGHFEQVEFKGKKIIPSALYFESKNKVVYGEKALKKGVVNPGRLIKEFKRDLGDKNVKYTITFDENDDVVVDNSITEQKIYVIDTNIFIEEPSILDQFSENDLIKLPMKVIDELGYREEQEETEVSAKMAIESIEKLKDSKSISFEESHLELLPEDLEKDSKNSMNDNKILSIATFFNEKEKNVILLTNDKGLILKADNVTPKIETLSLEQFQDEKDSEEDTISDSGNSITITPKEASIKLLMHIREECQKYISEDVQNAVITVPATFNQAKIGQVKEAGEAAGFDEVKIQKEPVAVGFAYAFDDSEDKTILVYDFGGGTFDISLLKIADGKIEIEATDGDPKLGGKDVTRKVVELIYDNFQDKHEIDMFNESDSGLSKKDFTSNKNAISNVAEDAKIALSDYVETEIFIPNLLLPDGSSVNLQFKLSRSEFEKEISEIRKNSLDIVKHLMEEKELKAGDIDEFVMAGGTSSIPSIRDSIKDSFGIEPKKSIDTSVVISQGAAIEAMRSWSESDTIQKKIIYNDNSLLDFGVGVKDHTFDLLIPSGTDLPFSETREYTTEKDDQESIIIRAFQRKTTYSDVNRTYDKGIDFIDEIIIDGIPKSKVNELTIKVTFELTKDDTLEISVEIFDKENSLLSDKNLKISRASNG